MRTKNDNDESGNRYEKNLALECDQIAKEVRLKCENEIINDNIRFRVNICLKNKHSCCDMKISEVIKMIDSVRDVEECFQDKHGEKWKSIDVEAREGVTKCTESQIKCAARNNMYGERIKLIDKGNKNAVCPACDALKMWEHVVLCEKLKDKQDVWVK